MKIKKKEKPEIDVTNIPAHIGFIMDGNGRWATRRGLPRTAGHKAGTDALIRVLEACRDFGVKSVSVYAFSTENFNRSKEECDYIFNLIKKFAEDKLDEFLKYDTCLNICGDLEYSTKLDDATKNALIAVAEKTKKCKSHILNLCFSYGGRHEITQAVNKLIKNGKTEITEEDISSMLYTSGQVDPDLIVRASGEHRLSNFLLWQSAYSEFYFPTEMWPEFNKKTVEKCILEYQKRERRFGNVK